MKGGVFVSDDSSASSWDSKLWIDGCCVPNTVSGAFDLIEVESVSGGSESRPLIGVAFAFVDAIFFSRISDVMDAESVSGDSEAGSLSFVFTVVESLAGLMVTELGKNISGTPGLISVSSDLMGGEFVSDESFVV